MKPSKWYRLLIFLVTFFVISLIFHFNLFHNFSEQFTDKLFLKRPVDSHIIIIAIDDESLKAIGSWPWPRAEFAKILDRLQGARAIGLDVNFSEFSKSGEKDDDTLAEALAKLNGKTVLPLELGPNDKISTGPLELFSKITKQGFVNIPLSNDGITRETSNTRGGQASFDYILATLNSSIKSGSDNFRIDYRGKAGSYLTFSFHDVSEGLVPANIFDNNLILIGATAPDLHDALNTPFGLMSGVEVHANVINTIINGKYFNDLAPSLSYLFLFLITLLVFYLVRRLKSIVLLSIAFLILLAILYGASAYLFTLYLIIPAVYFLFCIILSLIVSVAYEYLTESREKKFIRKSFQYYLPEDVVNELVEDPKKLVLGGESRELTILFSDIRGFTTVSEKMSPHELTQFLNDFLTTMSDIVMDNKGLVDKYIGDAIMAFWGAPKNDSNHAVNACRGAKAMLLALPQINEAVMSKGFPHLAIGIGLNTGKAIVGNMGSNKRFNYTVIGDEVNLASRLEGLTKYYKAGCIVSETTKREAEKAGDLYFRPLDKVLVKGKKDPRRLYELLAEPLAELLEKFYLEGLDHYEKGEWAKAISSFERALQASSDGPSEVFMERSKSFLSNPPNDWDGTYKFLEK